MADAAVKPKRSLITEPVNIITGAQGAAKTLFAIAQADALLQHGDAKRIFQIGINEPDLRKLPALPFQFRDWYKPENAELIDGAVIIVDEFHELMPQRGPGRPPEFVEALAQARKRGVRFIFITQSVEFDHFLKGSRCNRHFHLERKSGLRRSSIHEWANRFVNDPVGNIEVRKTAIVHSWKHDRRYYDWYVSAESHHFRVRFPLRVYLIPVFVAAVGYFIWQAYGSIGGLLNGASPVVATMSKASEHLTAGVGGSPQRNDDKALVVVMDAEKYLEQFKPIVPAYPWSAPVFQAREVLADPQMLCVGQGAIEDDGACHCYSEQMTPISLDQDQCWIIARHGIYNPFRAPLVASHPEAGAADGKGDMSPRPPGGESSLQAAVIPADIANGVLLAPTLGVPGVTQ